MTTLYLIRHGTTDSNINGLFQGSVDIPLNEQGFEQARYLGERFKNIHIDILYSSPLTRALQTADGICSIKSCRPIIYDDLREIDGGDLEGRSAEENREKYPEEMHIFRTCPAFFKAPNGETTREVYDRFRSAVSEILKVNRSRSIAIVSHGFAIQTYISIAKGMLFEKMERHIVGNTSVTKLSFDDNMTSFIEYIGDDSHLPEALRFDIAQNFLKR